MTTRCLWLHIDIDGTGKRWWLAIQKGGLVYFPEAQFDDDASVIEGRDMIEINRPDKDPT